MADTAMYNWCAMKSLLSNRGMELNYFLAYLEDRIRYSLELGLIDAVPKDKEKLLDVGDDITLKDIEELLSKRAQKLDEEKEEDMIEFLPGQVVINPDLSPEEKRKYEDLAKKEGLKVVPIEELSPTEAGKLLHRWKKERYPTIRWNFPWKDYIVVGVPDGITDAFVYEFKTTGKYSFLRYECPVAFAQADLYGYFFRRDKKRVQIYIREKKKVLSWMEKVDAANAVKTLQSFREIDKEGRNPPPPEAWKCRSCRFREKCVSYRTGR